LVEKSDLAGEVLAGKSTLNRLELTPATATAKARYKKIVADHAAGDRLLVDVFLTAERQAAQPMHVDCRGDRQSARGDPGRALFPRLLRSLLLSAAVHLLWRVPAGCALTAVEHRCFGRKCGRTETDRETDSCGVAGGAHPGTSGLGVLSRGADGLVRSRRRRLLAGTSEK